MGRVAELKFEFFEANGRQLGAEVFRLSGPEPRFAATLLGGTTRAEGSSPEEALRRLKRIVNTPPPRQLDRPGRVLVVDDNASCVQVIGTVCEHLGHQVLAARDGHEAQYWLHQGGIDLMITDLYMPGMHGLALLQLVRSVPAGRELPIIVVTAAGPNGVRQAQDAEVREVLAKPFEVPALMAAVQAVIVAGPAR